MHPTRSHMTRPRVVVAALAIATLMTACSETSTPTPVPPPAAAPAPPAVGAPRLMRNFLALGFVVIKLLRFF